MAIMHLTLGMRYHEVRKSQPHCFDEATEKMFPWSRSVILHASAIEAFQRGDRPRARQLLLAALKKASGGVTEAFIRIDLAWVHLCNEEVDSARNLCSPIEPWLIQHPAGLVVHALLESHAGRPDGALRAISAHLRLVGSHNRSSFAGLLDQLQARGPSRQRVDLTAFLQYPTTYLVQKSATSALLHDAEAEAGTRFSEAVSK